MKLSVIIPCYNEVDNIGLYSKELFPFLDKYDYELIFVDDGSNDNTYLELGKIVNPRVKVLKHATNAGMGAALKTGLSAATGEGIIFLDSDLTFSPRFIDNLVEAYYKSNADCVCGSHILGTLSDQIPRSRALLTTISNKMYSLILGQHFTAITPIFRLYKAAAIKSMRIDSNDFNVNAEILFKLVKGKGTIIELPVPLAARRHGTSKMNLTKEIKNHAFLITKILYWKLQTFLKLH